MALGILMMAASFVGCSIDKVKYTIRTNKNESKAAEKMRQGKNELGIYHDAYGRERDLFTGKECFVTRELNGDRVIKYGNGTTYNIDEMNRHKEGTRTARENKLKNPNDRAVFSRKIYPKEVKYGCGKTGELFLDSKDSNKKYLTRTFIWKPDNIEYLSYKKPYNGAGEKECKAEFYMDYDTGLLIDISDRCEKYLSSDNNGAKYKASKNEINDFIRVFNYAQQTPSGFYYYKNEWAEQRNLRARDNGKNFYFEYNQ